MWPQSVALLPAFAGSLEARRAQPTHQAPARQQWVLVRVQAMPVLGAVEADVRSTALRPTIEQSLCCLDTNLPAAARTSGVPLKGCRWLHDTTERQQSHLCIRRRGTEHPDLVDRLERAFEKQNETEDRSSENDQNEADAGGDS
jgi:hypothetical protein